jgi:TrmH family RNA methyltransferase
MLVSLVNKFQVLSLDDNYVIIPGLHALKHALRFGAEIILSLSDDKRKLLELATDLSPDVADFIKINVQEVSIGQYQSLIKDAHRTGVISIAKKPSLELKEVLKSEKPLVLIEDCRNLKNLGAVIRVSAAADIGGVLSLINQVNIWHPDVLVGAAGLNFALPCINISETDLSLIKQERTLIALDPAGSSHPELDSGSPEESAKAKPPIYIFGTERDGISENLLNLSDFKLRISMREGVSSLNLATSVAITLYSQTDVLFYVKIH